jgi:hypothetical protein
MVGRVYKIGDVEGDAQFWAGTKKVRRKPGRLGTGRKIEWNGETLDIPGWSNRLGIPTAVIYKRLKAGFPMEDVFYVGNIKERSDRTVCRKRGCNELERVVGGKYCRGHEYRLKRYGSVNAEKRNWTQEPAYWVWQNMNLSGVEIGWKDYEAFERDMGQPGEKGSGHDVLCRRDWNVGYNKENCFWGTKAQSRHIMTVEVDGVEKTLKELSEETGIKFATLAYRFRKKWPVEKMLRDRVS